MAVRASAERAGRASAPAYVASSERYPLTRILHLLMIVPRFFL